MITDAELSFWANIAAIAGFIVTLIGAGVGIYGYSAYKCAWHKKTTALIAYLKKKKNEAPDGKKGQQTAMHLTRYVGLTEDEILKISFENKYVERSVGKDEQGKADTLYFEYKP